MSITSSICCCGVLCYAQMLILVRFILVKLLSVFVITFDRGGVTTCKFDIIIPLLLPYLPIPTRTRNEGGRLQFLSPEVFKKKLTSTISLV